MSHSAAMPVQLSQYRGWKKAGENRGNFVMRKLSFNVAVLN
ncbi:hypothetical protein AC520_1444 [Enterobacter sp. OLF]|nr:hypothetical protein AC520_1444 [Enterobacter sp. OLF]